MTSTKFWQQIIGMLCVTAIQGYLIWGGRYEYTEWYFGFMGATMGIFTGLKTYQNLSYKDYAPVSRMVGASILSTEKPT